MKAIYDQTHFRISHNSEEVDFTIDTLTSFAPFNEPFAILTAWNPDNQPLSLEENTQRNEQLFETLLERGYKFDEALGYLEEHSEESYCIYGISFQEAIDLAKAFEQYAIFYRGNNAVGYYEVETSHIVTERSLS
jgi:hypothetical protein